jgi:hypothetical protein
MVGQWSYTSSGDGAVGNRRPQTLTSTARWVAAVWQRCGCVCVAPGVVVGSWGTRGPFPHTPRPSALACAWRASAICRSRPTGAGPSVWMYSAPPPSPPLCSGSCACVRPPAGVSRTAGPWSLRGPCALSALVDSSSRQCSVFQSVSAPRRSPNPNPPCCLRALRAYREQHLQAQLRLGRRALARQLHDAARGHATAHRSVQRGASQRQLGRGGAQQVRHGRHGCCDHASHRPLRRGAQALPASYDLRQHLWLRAARGMRRGGISTSHQHAWSAL